ncbi:hypothetical protein R3P38DRAFT_2867901 [Favolaschia claudopus]|uniref:Uncharacterized protein n=1 Tax=Favolaschia claudopus TaxID=2862362 RepID=A0AAW0DA71_9AGAR
MPSTILVESTNTVKRSRSSNLNARGEPAKKKQCSNERQARCRVESPKRVRSPASDLETILRRLAKSVDSATVKKLKGLVAGREQDPINVAVRSMIERIQDIVAEKFQGFSTKLLQVELYLEWLLEYDFVLKAIQNVLRAKLQTSIGKPLFSVLFHLIEEFICAVDAYQDGWSDEAEAAGTRCSWVMTLVEETKDSSTDERSVAAVRGAETWLAQFDAVMALAVKCYKSECADYKQLARTIGSKQETLSRSCCLLSEQTGFGDADDMGFGLLVTTREAMLRWRGREPSPEDSGYDS